MTTPTIILSPYVKRTDIVCSQMPEEKDWFKKTKKAKQTKENGKEFALWLINHSAGSWFEGLCEALKENKIEV